MPGLNVGTAFIDLKADVSGFQQDVAKKIDPIARRAERAFQRSAKQVQNLGKSLTLGLSAPLIGVGALSIKAAIDFESAFAGVRKTVDATEPELRKISDGIRKMSRELPASAVEISRVAEAAGQLGIQSKNILSFSRVMVDLGETTNLTADEAATALARIANIIQLPQDQFDRLGSTIVALGNAGASTEKEIVDMALRIAGAGKQVGLSADQVLAFANALSSVGVEADAGGSAISRAFIEIANSVATGGKKLSGFAKVAGISSEEFQKAFRDDAAGAMVAFIEGLDRTAKSGGNVFAVLDNLGLGEIRVRDALLRAAGAGDLFRESLDLGSKAWKENTALTNEARKRYETTAAKLKVLRNQITDIGITLGTALLPAIQGLVSIIRPIVSLFAGLAEKFAALPGPIKAIVTGILGLAAAAGPALFAVGKLGQIFGPGGTFRAGLDATGKLLDVFKKRLLESTAGTAAASTKIGVLGRVFNGLKSLINPVTIGIAGLGAVIAILSNKGDILSGALSRLATASKSLRSAEENLRAKQVDVAKAQLEVNRLRDLGKTSADSYRRAVDTLENAEAQSFAASRELFAERRKQLAALEDAIRKVADPSLLEDFKQTLTLGGGRPDVRLTKFRRGIDALVKTAKEGGISLAELQATARDLNLPEREFNDFNDQLVRTWETTDELADSAKDLSKILKGPLRTAAKPDVLLRQLNITDQLIDKYGHWSGSVGDVKSALAETVRVLAEFSLGQAKEIELSGGQADAQQLLLKHLAELQARWPEVSGAVFEYVDAIRKGIPLTDNAASGLSRLAGKTDEVAVVLSKLAPEAKGVAKAFAGLKGDELDKWREGTVDAISGVDDVLHDLAGRANLTSKQIVKAFAQQLKAQIDYRKNFEKLVARNLPDELLKQIQEMGIDGAGLVKALANSNNRDFNRIISDWKRSQSEAFRTSQAFAVIPRELEAIRRIKKVTPEVVAELAGLINNKKTSFAAVKQAILDMKNLSPTIRKNLIAKLTAELKAQASLKLKITSPNLLTPLQFEARLVRGGTQHEGGLIHGPGASDVPIIAQAGEYVLQRSAVKAIGLPALEMLNKIANSDSLQRLRTLGMIPPIRFARQAPELHSGGLVRQPVQDVVQAGDTWNITVVNPKPESLALTIPAARRRAQLLRNR